MSSVPSWVRRASKSLASRLDRLRQTFDHFRDHLREAVSNEIGQTVAGAVREAVHHLLDEVPVYRQSPAWRSQASITGNPIWDEADSDPWADPEERWQDEPSAYPHENKPVPPGPATQANLNRAVIVGCEAAAWWLRQRWGQLPLLAALVVGSLATVVSYVGGPLGAAGMAVAGSAVSLLTMAQNARIDADVVSTLKQND